MPMYIITSNIYVIVCYTEKKYSCTNKEVLLGFNIML